MNESIYMAFLVSVLRSMLLVAGGWLVSRGLVEDGLAREVASGLAVIVVAQVWAFVRIHRRRLYERWLVILGLDAEPTSDPEVAAAITQEAKVRVKAGWVP
jgi:hypothetical protein